MPKSWNQLTAYQRELCRVLFDGKKINILFSENDVRLAKRMESRKLQSQSKEH